MKKLIDEMVIDTKNDKWIFISELKSGEFIYNNKEVNSEFNNHYLTMYYCLLKKDNVMLVPDKHIYSISKDSQFTFNKFLVTNHHS